jgi:hypothetical protein
MSQDNWEPLCTALHGLQDLQDLKLALTFATYDEEMAELRFKDMTALTRLELSLCEMPDGAGESAQCMLERVLPVHVTVCIPAATGAAWHRQA